MSKHPMTISEPASSKTLIRKTKGKRDFGQASIQAALGKLAAKHEPSADYDLNVDMKDCSSLAVALNKLVRECRQDPARPCTEIRRRTLGRCGSCR